MKVYVKIKKEKIECMCLAINKLCDRLCEKGYANYDKFKDVEQCFKQNKFGK